MKIDDKKLSEILLRESYISEEELKKAQDNAIKDRVSLLDYLLDQNLLTKDLAGQAFAESLGVVYSDLNSNKPLKEQVLQIPQEVAEKFRCILYEINKTKKKITVTTDDPTQKELSAELVKVFPEVKITITYSLSEDIDSLLVYYHKALETRFSEIIKKSKRVAPEILEEIFEDAYVFHASDIHFEPQSKVVVVRFRIDGVLQEAGRIPREYYENILNRIKVQSRLRIDEHFTIQDGSMRYEKNGRSFDLRTSIVPTIEGEKVALRVLSFYVQGLSLSDLGLDKIHQKMLQEAAQKPFGMILVTGPTGSGKTTTLYALLKLLNHPDINITTIEDPVEYKIASINQIQVNPQTDLTFAKGLRSIVRQDPDIILVGEIRDQETAEIAINAALTGHILLSTFHANDAATAVPRLLDMAVEPFLLVSTLNVIIAQRLVRKICGSCRYSVPMTQKEIGEKMKLANTFFPEKNVTLYAGKGCNMCSGTGYSGRTAIFEFLQITPEIQDQILKNPSARDVWKIARSQGAKSLFEDGIEKVKMGITTIDELLRVAEHPNS